jgi:hypothetical protein
LEIRVAHFLDPNDSLLKRLKYFNRLRDIDTAQAIRLYALFYRLDVILAPAGVGLELGKEFIVDCAAHSILFRLMAQKATRHRNAPAKSRELRA